MENIINAGNLRHRVAIQRNTATTANDYGQIVPNWSTIATVWAAIDYLDGKEDIQAHEVVGRDRYKVTMRYTDVTIRDRLLFGNRTFGIESIQNKLEKNAELVLKCIETA